jgi:cyclohexadieny/prephenate dehydrogenase
VTDAGAIFQKVALVGAGLIGSSIARAARRRGLAKHIAAYIPRDTTRARAAKSGFADSLHAELSSAVAGADLVVLATPIGTFGELSREAAPYLVSGAILTDVGSVKGVVIRDVSPNVPIGVHFIPGHPVAGTEQSGPEAGFAELFDGRWCILTPPPGTDPQAVQKLKDFWQRCGSEVEVMDAEHHDLVLAITSHVPHLIAYNIVGTAADLETVTQGEVIKYSASGFRDFTRIATFFLITGMPCWRCSGGLTKIWRRFSALCDGATARPCSICSPERARFAARLSRRVRTPPNRILADQPGLPVAEADAPPNLTEPLLKSS